MKLPSRAREPAEASHLTSLKCYCAGLLRLVASALGKKPVEEASSHETLSAGQMQLPVPAASPYKGYTNILNTYWRDVSFRFPALFRLPEHSLF